MTFELGLAKGGYELLVNDYNELQDRVWRDEKHAYEEHVKQKKKDAFTRKE